MKWNIDFLTELYIFLNFLTIWEYSTSLLSCP